MAQFEPHVIHHSDAATPHYTIRFIGDAGESVTVECHIDSRGGDPDRNDVIAAAYEVVTRVASQASGTERRRTPAETFASPSSGLSRPVDEPEGATHTSEGRDRGTA